MRHDGSGKTPYYTILKSTETLTRVVDSLRMGEFHGAGRECLGKKRSFKIPHLSWGNRDGVEGLHRAEAMCLRQDTSVIRKPRRTSFPDAKLWRFRKSIANTLR